MDVVDEVADDGVGVGVGVGIDVDVDVGVVVGVEAGVVVLLGGLGADMLEVESAVDLLWVE